MYTNYRDLAQKRAAQSPRSPEHSLERYDAYVAEDWENLEGEIEAAERWRERFTHGLVHLSDGTVAVTEEMDLLHGIERMEKTVDRIIRTDVVATKRIKHPTTPDCFKYELTPQGDAVWTMCRTMVPLIEQLYPGCRKPARLGGNTSVPEGKRPIFNARLTVALHACQIALPILSRHAGMYLDIDQPVVRRALDHLLRTIRQVCRSRRFMYLENNYRRNAKLRFKSACQYMAGLFEEHSKLLIIRVDLYFPPDQKEWADTDAAGRSIGAFMRALREGRVVPDMRGWAVRLENGPRRGIHAHLLVAMDGHLHREAVTWSKVLGEAWVNKYSKGHGTYFNCCTRQDSYKFNGLGLVHISETQKLMGIREALRYMTKADFHIATGFTRSFRKGLPYRAEGAAKRGAPRKTEHDMQWVSHILRGGPFPSDVTGPAT